jgi:hypothetical protein
MLTGVAPNYGFQRVTQLCREWRIQQRSELREYLADTLLLLAPAGPRLALTIIRHVGLWDSHLARLLPPELSQSFWKPGTLESVISPIQHLLDTQGDKRILSMLADRAFRNFPVSTQTVFMCSRVQEDLWEFAGGVCLLG